MDLDLDLDADLDVHMYVFVCVTCVTVVVYVVIVCVLVVPLWSRACRPTSREPAMTWMLRFVSLRLLLVLVSLSALDSGLRAHTLPRCYLLD